MTTVQASGGTPPRQRRFQRKFNRKRFLVYQVVGFFAVLALLHVGFNADAYLPAEWVPAWYSASAVASPASGVPQSQALRGADGAAAVAVTGNAAAAGVGARKLLEDFPPDLLLNGDPDSEYSDSTNKYVLLLHGLGVIYMFVGLAVVCDDYFVAALEEMCDTWGVTEDVAGATFMAAGGSAPELFTSLLGVFVAQSDVGFGTIVGSAVFNVLFVIGLCALFAKAVLDLTWWPLARDCSYYTFGLIVLILCVRDNVIHWYEALLLLLCYAGYVTIMKFNLQLKAKVEKWIACGKPRGNGAASSGSIKTVEVASTVKPTVDAGSPPAAAPPAAAGDGDAAASSPPAAAAANDVEAGTPADAVTPVQAADSGSGRGDSDTRPLNTSTSVTQVQEITPGNLNPAPRTLPSARRTLHAGESLYCQHHALAAQNEAVRFRDYRSTALRAIVHGHLEDLNRRLVMSGGGTELERRKSWRYRTAWNSAAEEVKQFHPHLLQTSERGDSSSKVVPVTDDDNGDVGSSKMNISARVITDGQPDTPIGPIPEFSDAKDGGDGEDEDSLWDVPESKLGKAAWLFALPINFLLFITIPNCKNPRFQKLFLVTFALSLVWIAAFSYFMVWWASTIGFALNIPAPVMGLTILAGGTSIPDALSSVIVARNGFGDMAVSSSIGSNIFDINVGLPLPWLLKTVIVSPGETVPIHSCGMAILSISLLFMVLFVVLSIKFSGWKLGMKLGGVMFVLYLVFVAESLMLEYDVFGKLTC